MHKQNLVDIASKSRFNLTRLCFILCLFLALFSGCHPTPTANVLNYLIAQRLGTLDPPAHIPSDGVLTGLVLDGSTPVAGATVLVAERTGTPHAAQTDAQGRYRIENIPPGYRARETYELTGTDGFVERFEIADPGKDFVVYSETRFTRVR